MLQGILFALCLLFAAGYGAQAAAAPAQEGGRTVPLTRVYKVAFDEAYAPFSFYAPDGSFTGMEVDLLKAVADRQHLKIQIEPRPFDFILQQLMSGRVDAVMAGLNVNRHRQATMDFSQGYFNSCLCAVTSDRADNPLLAKNIRSLKDLHGLKVAVKYGTTGSLLAERFEEECGFDLMYVSSTHDMLEAVSSGQADILFEDLPVMVYHLEQGIVPGLRILLPQAGDVSYYAMAVAKGRNQDLLQSFDAALQELRADGTYDKIVSKYFPPQQGKDDSAAASLLKKLQQKQQN